MKKRYMALLLACAVFMGACSTNTASTGGSSTTDSPATASTEATTDAAAEASTASEANTGETTTEEGDPTYTVVVKDGVSYLPVAEIASAIGYTVSGDGPEVKISNGNWDVTINGESQTLEASYQEGSIPVEATVEGDIVYLSEKAINEYVNVDVVIEGESATATVSAVAAARDAIRGNEYGIKASFEYETYEVMLPMEDGVELRTIVYKPVGDGPFPTAFTRGPYPGQEPTKMALGEEYAKRGVAYVFQYCRGKGGSGGEYVANVDERRDGDASLQWLNNEPWVESIGMHGHSYLALTTWIVGDILPEKVKALHVQCYGVLRNLSVSHSGLVATDNICAWTLGNCTDVGFDYDLYLESAQYLPQIEVDEALWGGKVEGYADWVNHPDFTDAYWNEGVWGDLKNAIGKIDVPTGIFVGYYDHHFEGNVEAWSMLSAETRAQSHMVLGPWNHSFGHATTWKGGDNWMWDVNADTFNWFYSILVNGEVPTTGIDAYVVGKDEWVHLDTFPIEADDEMTLYMTDEAAQAKGTASVLSAEKPEAETTFEYDYDPKDPKYAEGGECFLYSNDLRGSNELSEEGYRQDVISFVSEPMDNDTTLAGNLVANLFVSTDVEDTAFTYTISEIDESGVAHNIRNGLLTLAYRNDRYAAAVNDYVPGQVVEMKIESLPIVWNIAKGNRIRIDISSSDFPEFSNHTNTVGNWAEQTETKVAHQIIYAGGEHASYVSLPILND